MDVNRLEIIQTLLTVGRKLAPWVCLRVSGEYHVPFLWNGQSWHKVKLEDLPQPTPFGHCVWLIAEEDTYFRNRSFPADMVDANSFDEAIALDIQSWSPWGDKSGYFYWSVLDGEQWRVAVWTWDAGKEDSLRSGMVAASGFELTHAMPEQAWHAASLRATDVPALLLRPTKDYLSCILVDEFGLPIRVASVSDAIEGSRFLRSVGDRVATYLLDTEEEQDTESCMNQSVKWVIQDSTPDSVRQHLPSSRVLARARLPGVKDWTDPLVWRRPAMALLALWLFWLAGSSAILWNRSAAVEAELKQVRASAENVLSLRDRVSAMHNRLAVIQTLRERQQRELRFLAALSKKLPLDAYLLSIVNEGDWVNIQGRAKAAATVGAVLEDLPGIDHVAYVGDIRPIPATEQESFHLRLHFSGAGK